MFMLDCCRRRGVELTRLTGSDRFTFAARAADGGTMGEWSIRWTGRTERESILGGELPFIRTLFDQTAAA